jgi:hypothetical protein
LVSEIALKTETVELVASIMRLSVDAARELLGFRAQVVLTFEELRAALGDACGEFWFLDRRLQVGVAGSGDPPAGAHVDAARHVLERHGLLAQSDLVAAGPSSAEMLAAADRVASMLTGWHFARVALRNPEFNPHNLHEVGCPLSKSLWIETMDGLAEVQEAIVEAAIAVAGVPVQISKSLGPGPCYSPIPVRQIPWVVINAGADGRSLLIRHHWAGDLGRQASLSLDESDTQISIAIALPDLRRYPNAPPNFYLPDNLGSRRLTVWLDQRVGGRRINGPQCALGGDQRFRYKSKDMPDGTVAGVIPNVIGLAPEDAINVLRAQEFEPKRAGDGREVVVQDPAAESVATTDRQTVILTAGP